MAEPKRPLDQSFFGHSHVTVLEPGRAWMRASFRELWAYRELLWVLAARDVQVRYKQTIVGAGWAVIRPFLTMIVFTIVFGRFARIPSDGFAYPVFAYSALLPWTFFAAGLSAAGSSVLGSANLIGKVYFPRLVVPLASIGSAVVDLVVSTGVLLALMVYYRVAWSWRLGLAPFLLLAVAAAALGVGMLVAAWTVSYRDLQHLTPFALQIWMFATPVIYSSSLFPAKWRWLLLLNPIAGLVEGLRSAFLGRPFDAVSLAISLAAATALMVVGVVQFERSQRRFADLL